MMMHCDRDAFRVMIGLALAVRARCHATAAHLGVYSVEM